MARSPLGSKPVFSDATILKHIARQSKRQAGYKQLVRELALHGDERRELSSRLEELVKTGALIPVDSDRYALPQAASDKNLIPGRLSMHRDGFGFVIPDAQRLNANLKAKLAGDIFIPPHQIGNAMHGDLVLVDIANVRPDGRAARSRHRLARSRRRAQRRCHRCGESPGGIRALRGADAPRTATRRRLAPRLWQAALRRARLVVVAPRGRCAPG